jgi:glycosyltransferase involved in cell wall biosynthesis
LCARHEHIKLLLIGDGPMSDDLRSQAKALGVADRIIFTGLVPRTEVTRYLALIDLAVLPHSNKFGSPVVMFEFMGLHIPVVAPRLEPILDVHGDETTARLFDPLDRDQLEAAVEDLLTNAGAARVQAARAHARLLAHHTWQRNAEQILTTAGLLSPPDATMAPSHPQESH